MSELWAPPSVIFLKPTLGCFGDYTWWQANLWKLLDIYDDINFAGTLATLGVTLGYPRIQQKRNALNF